MAHLIRKARDLAALLAPLPKTSEIRRAIEFCEKIQSLLFIPSSSTESIIHTPKSSENQADA